MRIIKRDEFLAIEQQVVYAKVYGEWKLGELHIKLGNAGENDWVKQPITADSVKCNDSAEYEGVIRKAFAGENVSMDFDNGVRDGCYERDNVLFAVFDQEDVRLMVKALLPVAGLSEKGIATATLPDVFQSRNFHQVVDSFPEGELHAYLKPFHAPDKGVVIVRGRFEWDLEVTVAVKDDDGLHWLLGVVSDIRDDFIKQGIFTTHNRVPIDIKLYWENGSDKPEGIQNQPLMTIGISGCCRKNESFMDLSMVLMAMLDAIQARTTPTS